MGLSVQEAHSLMLTVDFDEGGAKLLEHRDAGCLIIDEGTASTIGGEGPAQDKVFIPRIGEPLVL